MYCRRQRAGFGANSHQHHLVLKPAARHLAASSALPRAEHHKPGELTSAANCFLCHTGALRHTVYTASNIAKKQPKLFSGAECLITTTTQGTAQGCQGGKSHHQPRDLQPLAAGSQNRGLVCPELFQRNLHLHAPYDGPFPVRDKGST